MRRQQHPLQFEEKFLASTTSASIVGPVIGLNVIKTYRVLRKRTIQGSAPADNPELTTVRLEEDYILPVKRPEKSQRRASSVDAIQPIVELIPATPRKGNHNCHNKSVAPPSSKKDLFDDVQRDSQPIKCTAEDHF